MSRIARDASKDDTDPEVSGPSGGRESRVAALKARSTLAEIIAFARGQIVGEVIDDRLAGRDFEPGDVGVRNAREMLDERAQADRKSQRLNSSHTRESRMPSYA